MGLCSIPTVKPSTPPLLSGGFWILLMLCNLFQKKVSPLTTPAVNVSFSISRKGKQTTKPTIPYRSSSFLFLNILMASTIPDVLMALLACLLPIRLNCYTGSKTKLPLSYFLHSYVYFFDYGSTTFLSNHTFHIIVKGLHMQRIRNVSQNRCKMFEKRNISLKSYFNDMRIRKSGRTNAEAYGTYGKGYRRHDRI